ncbi:helix-turn-helix domain-containing protein [Streptomyces sp. NRRL S-350]|uniref:helix-turn-helix domain-containing protein n=1 Tax=Streptomyces sp. NRRL S-350 TaxID=1463902 RepID=UPI0004BFAFD4|nr:helix-turn-helix domain-containing protein [Streptomyces sp. NRRL S-350]
MSNAGVARPGPKKYNRLTGEKREKVGKAAAKSYDGGASIRSLAETYDLSYGAMHRLLGDMKVTFRNRGGARGSHEKRPAAE